MEMSEIRAARVLLGGRVGPGAGSGGGAGAARATVRYGTVTAVDAGAGTVTVLVDGQDAPVTLTDPTAAARLKVGDRVKIVKQGQSWVIDLAGGLSRAIDASVEKAEASFKDLAAKWGEHEDKMKRYESDMAAAKDELAGMDGRISDAVDKAVSQIETPDGGNRVYARADEPPAPDGGFKQGDLWYRTNASGQIAAVEVWDGSSWRDYDIVANSVLVPGSVGGTLIADGSVTTAKMTAGAVTADKIAANTITGAEIRAGSVDVNSIASDDILCKRLSAVGGTGYAQVTGSGLELYNSSSSNLLRVLAANSECQLWSPAAGKIAVWTDSSSVMRCSSAGYSFSSETPGFKVGNVAAVECYSATPASTTSSTTATFAYLPATPTFLVVYYSASWQKTVDSVKVPISRGGSAKVALRAFTDGGSSLVVSWENVVFSLPSSGHTSVKLTITRGSPYRINLTAGSGSSLNESPGTSFSITRVTICG